MFNKSFKPDGLRPPQLISRRRPYGPLRANAERGGFEPPVRRKANNGFRDRRIRPLCHLSLII